MFTRFCAALGLLAAGSAASAQMVDDGSCRNGGFGVQNPAPSSAVVTGKGRAYFLLDMDGCPNASRQCRQSSYLVPGDRLVAGRTKGRYVCAYYPGKGGGSAGWMEVARLSLAAPPRSTAVRDWVGRWSDEGNPIVRFYLRRGKLMVEGDSYWPSPNPPESERPYGPNVGHVAEEVQVSGNVSHAVECNITFTLVGEFLIGADPDTVCDGANATFTGVYQRAKK